MRFVVYFILSLLKPKQFRCNKKNAFNKHGKNNFAGDPTTQ